MKVIDITSNEFAMVMGMLELLDIEFDPNLVNRSVYNYDFGFRVNNSGDRKENVIISKQLKKWCWLTVNGRRN